MNDPIYYEVDSQKTYSRNQAIVWAGGDISRIKFRFMEETWDSIDWTQEPTENFDFLCQKRCWQIRENNSWVCLWLSGGYDSVTILRAFEKSKARIDEIAFMDRSDYFDDPELPYIWNDAVNYKNNYNPKVKITPVNIDHQYTNSIYLTLGNDWILSPGVSLRYSKSTSSYVHQYNNDVSRIKSATACKRIDVYGKEKPLLDLRDGKWYMSMIDLAIVDNMGVDNEFFYINSNMPELHVKQCYLAIKWFESLPGISHEMVHLIQSHAPMYYQQWNLALGRFPVLCPDSQHATQKKLFTQNEKSIESQKLLNFVGKENHKSLGIYRQGLSDLELCAGKSAFQALHSKQWYIRDFKDSN
jgi:hypothetical protein